MAHGDYGAQGRPSWELLWEHLDSLIEYRVGWRAQLRYLDEKRGGAAYLAAAGLTPSRDQRRRWAGKGQPTRANQATIARAYRQLRRRNAAGPLIRKLEQGGGVQVEIHPESQTPVIKGRKRDLEVLGFRVRRWAILITAWASGDQTGFEQQWLSILEDAPRSDWAAYQFASAVGIII
jgi:hypothetical protein